MKEIITAIIFLTVAIGSFIISVRSFKEKGFLFNNAYLYSSKQERSQMNKKPYYRQTAIIFLLIGIALLLYTFNIFLNSKWMFYIIIAIIIITIIYAIVSSIKIELKKN